MYSIYVTYPQTKTLYIRANNSCGSSASTKYVLNSLVDLDNKALATSLEENEEKVVFSVYPNPVSDRLTFQTTAVVKSVECFNTLGQRSLLSLDGNTASVAHLPSGIYYLTIYTQEGGILNAKFIRE